MALHFTPTSNSWTNLIERWFKELTDRRLRRVVFTSVAKLAAGRRPARRGPIARARRRRGGALAVRAAPDDVVTTVEELISTEAALRLIGQLPVEQREAVLLRHVAGLDVRRTADVVGRTPGAVRVATHRGLATLRELLDQPADARREQPSNAHGPGIG
ncbi:MAG: polymerase sigma-70 factor, subfamily [Actinomycetota bacterium]|nr:polymerase sigma-70 factor, subfamily [Actinomycetota bacterium]